MSVLQIIALVYLFTAYKEPVYDEIEALKRGAEVQANVLQESMKIDFVI